MSKLLPLGELGANVTSDWLLSVTTGSGHVTAAVPVPGSFGTVNGDGQVIEGASTSLN